MAKSQVVDSALTEQDCMNRIRRLISDGDARGARALATELAAAHPGWQEVANAAAVLAPSKARTTGKATGRDRTQEMKWLREHGEQYTGNWVALRGSKLLGANPDRVELRNRLAERGELEGSLFAFLPDDPLCYGA